MTSAPPRLKKQEHVNINGFRLRLLASFSPSQSNADPPSVMCTYKQERKGLDSREQNNNNDKKLECRDHSLLGINVISRFCCILSSITTSQRNLSFRFLFLPTRRPGFHSNPHPYTVRSPDAELLQNLEEPLDQTSSIHPPTPSLHCSLPCPSPPSCSLFTPQLPHRQFHS